MEKRVTMSKRSSQLGKSFAARSGTSNSWMTGGKPRLYNVYDFLESIAWTWRVLGIFPFTIKNSTGTKKYRINKFYAVYSLILAAVCIIHFIYMMARYVSRFSVPGTTVFIRTLASLVSMIVFSIWRICRYREIEEFIEIIASEAAVLEKLNCRVNFEKMKRLSRAYISITLMTIFCITIYDMCFTRNYFGKSHYIFFIFPLVGQIVNVTILVTLVGLLGLKFRAINAKIRTVVTRANGTSPNIIVTSDLFADNLRRLSKVHYNICTVGKRINRFFDLDVIINVTTAFIILSMTLYFIFVEVHQDGKTDYVQIVKYVQIEIVHSVPIIVVVTICNWTTHQSIHTGKLIHEIRIEKIDSRLYEAVKSFALQLHHQKLEFTAGGFFPLNSTLIQTIVGNITTYLVLLIQFHPSLN